MPRRATRKRISGGLFGMASFAIPASLGAVLIADNPIESRNNPACHPCGTVEVANILGGARALPSGIGRVLDNLAHQLGGMADIGIRPLITALVWPIIA